MEIRFVLYLVVPVIFGSVNGFISNKTIEGHPVGFLMEECPGSMKPAIISPKNLGNIRIHVNGIRPNPNPKLNHLGNAKKRIKYNYHMVKQFAEDPTMDWSKPILLFAPGWMTNIHFPFPLPPLVETLYKQRGYNVWLMEIFMFMAAEYPVASRAMMTVGKHIGEMLAKLKELQPKFDPKKLNILGISLGGHTMGFIAKTYYNITGEKIGRLTGMDPSGPCFRNRGPDERVDESDADFVELILTNIDGLGMAAPSGHINYYVNGGEFQPGDGYWMICGPICSHVRSASIWIASLLYPKTFIAMKCDSVQQARDRKCYDRVPMETNFLGLEVDKSKPGIYYLATHNNIPYYLKEKGLKKENDFILRKMREMNAREVLRL